MNSIAPPVTSPSSVFKRPEMAFRVQKVYKPWIAAVEEATGGMVKIEPYYAESLVPMPDSYDAVTKGTIDIGEGLEAFQSVAKFTMGEVITFTSYDRICWKPSAVAWELYEKFPEWQAEYADSKVLFLNGACILSSLGTTKKPVRKLEDIQGLKLICAWKWLGKRLEALGGIPLTVPPTDYTELEKGVADGGSTIVLRLLWDFRFGDVIKYAVLVPTGHSIMFTVMNLDKWNSLPPDIQKAIDSVSGAYQVEMADREYQLKYKECLELAPKEFGLEWIVLSEEELARWVEADNPVREEFVAELEAKGLPGRELMDERTRLDIKYSAAEYEIK